MNTRLLALGMLGLCACSRALPQHGARAVTTRPALQATAPVAEHAPAPERTPLAYHSERDTDRAFIESAERAIREYREFIARAGDSQEYAAAVKRSREQIHDLQDTLVFVREGSESRVEQH